MMKTKKGSEFPSRSSDKDGEATTISKKGKPSNFKRQGESKKANNSPTPILSSSDVEQDESAAQQIALENLRRTSMARKKYNGDLFSSKTNGNGDEYITYISRNPKSGLEARDAFRKRATSIKVDPVDSSEQKDIKSLKNTKEVEHEIRRRNRFALSLKTLSMKPESIRRKIVRHGALQVLINLATYDDEVLMNLADYEEDKLRELRDLVNETKQYCIEAFYNFSTDKNIKVEMIEKECSKTLMRISSVGKSYRYRCAKALCNLASCKDKECKLVADGIITALQLDSLKTDDDQMSFIVVATLLNLSCVSTKYSKIDDVDNAVMECIKNITPPTANRITTPNIQLMVLQCLVNLTAIPDNTTRLVENNVIELVKKNATSRIIKNQETRKREVFYGSTKDAHESKEEDYENHEAKLLCTKIFSNLSSCNRSRTKLVDKEVTRTLKELLKCKNSDIDREAAKTISRLALDTTCRNKLISLNAVTAVVEMTASPEVHPDTLKSCAIALRIFCQDKELAKTVVQDKGVDAMITLIRSDAIDSKTAHDVLRSLCGLFQYSNNVDALIDAGAVTAIVEKADPDNLHSSIHCARALYALSWHENCNEKIINKSVIETLCKLTTCEDENEDKTHKKDPSESAQEVRLVAIAALWSLTHQKGKSADPASAIPGLLKYLTKSISMKGISINENPEKHAEATGLAAAAICNMAKVDKNVKAIFEFDRHKGVQPLVQLCDPNNEKSTRIHAGAVLCRLTHEESNRNDLTRFPNFIKELVGLCNIDDDLTKQRAAIALVNMSTDKYARTLMREADVHTPKTLIDLALSNRPDNIIRKCCAAIFLNLSHETQEEVKVVKIQNSKTNKDAIQCLLIVAIIASDDSETKLMCAKALYNLMFNDNLHEDMRTEGVLWGLAKMTNEAYKKVEEADKFVADRRKHEKLEATYRKGKEVTEADREAYKQLWTISAKCFCNMATKYPEEVSKISSAKAIFNLMHDPDLEICRNSAKALTNLVGQLNCERGKERHRKKETKEEEGMTNQRERKRLNYLYRRGVCSLEKAIISSNDDDVISYAITSLMYISNTKLGREAIFQNDKTQLISLITKEDIFENRVDLAEHYANMMTNLCCNEDSRDKAFTSGCVEGIRTLSGVIVNKEKRLQKIELKTMTNIAFCCSKALYCLSTENKLPHLISSMIKSFNLIEIMEKLMKYRYESRKMVLLLSYSLYNFSLVSESQSKLVKDGIVAFMKKQFWSFFTEADRETRGDVRRNCALASSNLGCGQVNSRTMVADGAGIMLQYLSTIHNPDYQKRAAISLRNLLLRNANHDELIDYKGEGGERTTVGAIETLVELYYKTDDIEIKQNCASALRNITYNKKWRHHLVITKAIDVIIEDSDKGSEKIDDGEKMVKDKLLLFEIEAESWQNGSRAGCTREGRRPAPSQLLPDTSLIESMCQSQPGAPVENPVTWEKLDICVLKEDEPPLDLGETMNLDKFSEDTKIKSEAEIDLSTHKVSSGKIEINQFEGEVIINWDGLPAIDSLRRSSRATTPANLSNKNKSTKSPPDKQDIKNFESNENLSLDYSHAREFSYSMTDCADEERYLNEGKIGLQKLKTQQSLAESDLQSQISNETAKKSAKSLQKMMDVINAKRDKKFGPILAESKREGERLKALREADEKRGKGVELPYLTS